MFGVMDNPVKDQIRQAGGQTAVANAMDVPVTTVHSWGVKGEVPSWRRDAFDHCIAQLVRVAELRAA